MNILAAVLAAGSSRRLGHAKQLALIQGEPLLRRTVRTVLAAGCANTVVITGAYALAVGQCVADLGVDICHNGSWTSGMASSIHAAVHSALNRSTTSDALMLFVCDQPHLNTAHLAALVRRFKSTGCAVGSVYQNTVGVPAIFPAQQFPELLCLYGQQGARSLLSLDQSIKWELGSIDIDTPADLSSLALTAAPHW
jgi:molybdenum cofactor cytidylyltransferase